jgi:hypothetical protein
VTVTRCSYPASPGDDFPCGEAVLSDDGTYRYVLNRRWSGGPVLPWVGLNPSYADEARDDNAVAIMCRIARREGYGGICVLNLYALRATSPIVLGRHPDPAGPDNDRWIAGVAGGVTDMTANVPVVVFWGAHPMAAARVPRVLGLLTGLPLACLGITASGAPRHMRGIRRDAPLVPYTPPGGAV